MNKSINQVYVSIDVVQHALPWWQLQGWWQQILYNFISLCPFKLAFGAVGQFFGQQVHLYC